MAPAALLHPFLYSDIPSTAGLMDSFLPLYHNPIDARAREGLPPAHTPKSETRVEKADQVRHKETSATNKSRKKGKGREQILGEKGGRVSEQVAHKKAMRWAGRTIYSVHAAMSHATPGRQRLSPHPPTLDMVMELSEPRLSEGRDFLPAMPDSDDEDFLSMSRLRRLMEGSIKPAQADEVVSGESTPELGWSSPSSSSSSPVSLSSPSHSLTEDSGRLEEWTVVSYGGEEKEGLGLWLGESELEVAAEDMFLRFINMDECVGVRQQ